MKKWTETRRRATYLPTAPIRSLRLAARTLLGGQACLTGEFLTHPSIAG